MSFVDLRTNGSTDSSHGGFWPSFTDIMMVVVMIPNPNDLGIDPVAFSNAISRNPPLNSLKPSSSINMPNRKIATPADIS